MQFIDYWLCSSCQRTLAEKVHIGEGCTFSAMCWGCGLVNILPEPVTMSDIPEGIALEDVASGPRKRGKP